MTVFCYSEIRAGVTSDLMFVDFLPFSLFFLRKHLDSFWFSVLVPDSHFPSQFLRKPYLPHSITFSFFFILGHPLLKKKKKHLCL